MEEPTEETAATTDDSLLVTSEAGDSATTA